jgi:phosphoesterase RecJ-like protein
MPVSDVHSAAQPIERLDQLIRNADQILVAAHKNPDGDAIGAILAMSRMLDLMGLRHTVYCPEGVPSKLRFLHGAGNVTGDLAGGRFDLTLLFDTAEAGLLPPGFPDRAHQGLLAVIDHHLRCDDMGDLIIRYSASSAGEILFDLAKSNRWPLDDKIAECLYTSIVSDTSSFRYESATPAAHTAAAELIARGAAPWRVASHLYESVPMARQRLLARVLGTLKIGAAGRYAEMWCTAEMLDAAGATRDDLDGMVNFARAVDGVELAALFREEASGEIKLSLRSKGRVDASLIAGRFGGGGHRNAGGAYFSGVSIDEAARSVADQVLKILEEEN